MSNVGSFDNPVWTVTEVAGIYLLGVIAVFYVVYFLAKSGCEAVQDIRTFFKWAISRLKNKSSNL